jgi:Arc/MetJ family transcription regulator
MPTNLFIDDRLLGEAQAIGRHKTKRETVNEALREYIQRRKQAELLNLFGKVDFDPAYEYKRQRKRK